MTEEKQAIKILADELVKAMKSVSANTPSRYARHASEGGGSVSAINASKIVGLPAALAAIMETLESSAAGGDAVAQQILDVLNRLAAGEFETITADTANIEKLYATFGSFITLVADNATIGDLDVGEIRAGLAEVGLLNVGQAEIDIGQIKRLSTGTAFIREQIGGKVFIDDLAVSEANIVSLGVGQLLINNSNGELVELYVDDQGEVRTRDVTYDGDDILNANSIDGSKLHEASVNGNRLIANTITTREINASNIFAASGTVMDLIGDNIDATRISTGSLNAGIIKTGILGDVAGKNYWNMLTGDFSLSGSTTVGGENIATTTQLANAVTTLNSGITDLQNQIDGNITTWFYGVNPTTTNTPAVLWDTDAKKNEHLGDLYYNTVNGYCWRWMVSGNEPNYVYSWERISDTDVTKALSDAALAKDTADAKRRVFVVQPTPPYDVGDLWVQGTSGDIMRCANTKAEGTSYASSDWVKASKYTDDTAVTALSNALNQQEIFNRLTNNGVEQGIYLLNNKVYINGQYIKANTITTDMFTSTTKASLVTGSTTETQYYLSTSSSSAAGGSWSSSVTWETNKYVWTRTKTVTSYADSTSSTSYKPSENGVYDANLTKALSDAASADSKADNAVSTANSASSSISTINSNAVARRQTIYRYRANDNALSAYETWCTESSATPGTANWTTTRPAYQTSYPYLFTAEQTQTITQRDTNPGTACSCTTPVLDRTTTVIDGNAIITETVNASKIKGGTLKLGGSGNGNGTLQIVNASNSEIGTWTKDGISVKSGTITLGNTSANASVVITDQSSTPVKVKYVGSGTTWTTSLDGDKIEITNGSQSLRLQPQQMAIVNGNSYIYSLNYNNGSPVASMEGTLYVKGGLSFGSGVTLSAQYGGTGLTSSPSMIVNLGSTSYSSVFQSYPQPGITGTLGVANGGTGASLSSSPSMLTNLGSTTAANIFTASPRPGVTGTLAVGNGGTGRDTLTSGKVLVGNGTSAVSLRGINDCTSPQYISENDSLITGNTLINSKGSENIAKVGTITTGTWQGSTIGVSYGGTGITVNPSMLINLASTSNDTVFKGDPRPGVTGTLAITNGGTGGANRKTAIDNIAFLGNNITSSTSADTRAFWAEKGTGYAWYNALNRVNGQPNQWGYLFSFINGNEVYQLWFPMGMTSVSRGIFVRSGNSSTTAMPAFEMMSRPILTKTMTSQTTNSNGNISFDLAASTYVVIGAYASGNYGVVPYTNSSGVWGGKLYKVDTSSFTPAASVSGLTVNVLYMRLAI